MAAKVFISYRRDDSRYQARMIHEAFCRVIPRDDVFMDIASIQPGADFRKILKDWVAQCEVLLALIGPGWIDAGDPKTKQRRLNNPSDFVRIEIAEALARDIPVVPVLMDGTPMPEADLLPDDMKGLVDRQAEFVEYRTFDTDVEQLVRKLKRRLDDVDAQKRRRDAERRRLEEERKRAAKEEERRKRWEQEPQQPVRWWLPLIGAGAASLPVPLVALWTGSIFYLSAGLYMLHAMINALYGGAAGMLIRRFGILKAVAIPVIPALLLLLVVATSLWNEWRFHFRDLIGSHHAWMDTAAGFIFSVVVSFVPAVICTGLAFWLHSLWARKHGYD